MEAPATSVRKLTLPRTAELQPVATFLFAFLLIAVVAGSAGGFRATTVGWTSVATLWLATVLVLVTRRVEIGWKDVAFAGMLALFAGWAALSNLWTSSMTSTMHEVGRDIAYVGIVAASLLVVRKATIGALLGGVLAGIVVLDAYALGTRVLPDRLGGFDSSALGYRLATPITSWNGLGIFIVMGMLLALGFATRGERIATRALGAAALPMLAATMFFTFSRGAWVALLVGVVAFIAIDPRRLQLIAVGAVLAPFAALGVIGANSLDALKTQGSTLADAVDDGRTLLWWVLALALLAGVAAGLMALLERRVEIPVALRRGFAAVVVGVALAGVVFIWSTEGDPVTLAQRGWDTFNAPNTKPTSPHDLSERLLQLSSNGRANMWRVAWRNFEREPVLGHGAGTFWQLWAKDRDINADSRDAHSLYFGSLSELGAIGLGLVLLALAIPVVAAVMARKTPLVSAAFAVFAAWAAHTAVDFDWALIGVSACALLAAAALLAASRTGRWDLRWTRYAVAATFVVMLAWSVTLLASDTKLAAAHDAFVDERPERAIQLSHDASRWAPWSSEPWEFIGIVEALSGQPQRALVAYRRAVDHDASSWPLWQAVRSKSRGAERARAERELHRLNPRL